MKKLFPALFVLAWLSPAQAQTLSKEADFAMWCIAAIDYMDDKGLLPAAFDEAREDAVYDWHEGVIDKEIPVDQLPMLR